MTLTADLNVSPSVEKTMAENAKSIGGKLSPSTIQAVSSGLEDLGGDASIREYMAAHGVDFVKYLTEDGVLSANDRIKYLDPETGGLNEDGKVLYENALLGNAIDDVKLLERAPRTLIDKLASSLGPLVRIKTRSGDWDIRRLLVESAQIVGEAYSRGVKVPDMVNQNAMFGEPIPKGIQVFAEFLDRKPAHVKRGLRQFATESGLQTTSQGTLGTEAIEPYESFNAAFVDPIDEPEPIGRKTKQGKPKPETPAEREKRLRRNEEARRRAAKNRITREEYEDALRKTTRRGLESNKND